MERSQLTFPLSEAPRSNGSPPLPAAPFAAVVQPSATGRPANPVGAAAPNWDAPVGSGSAEAPARKTSKSGKAAGARKSAARKQGTPRRSAPRRPAAPPVPAWERFVVTFGATAVRLVAAAVSYEHMRALAAEAGEGWRSWLLPISVDGLAVVALVTIRRCRRLGLPADRMAWLALALALVASLAANVAAAVPTTAGRLVAAWPPAALLLAEVIHKHRGGATGANHVAARVSSKPAPGRGA